MRRSRSRATTQLVTILFTDIVTSTDIAREVGDRRWRELVDAHHRIVRSALKRHHGRELDTAGDGFFASFDKPAEAIRCAFEASEGVREIGLEIRAGLHLGEAEVIGPKVGGVVVNAGARIMGVGKAGEILVSSTVRDAVAGKGIGFVDHGVHELKGFDGEFRLFDVVGVEGMARSLPLEAQEARRRREAPLAEPARRRPWWLVPVAVLVLAAAGIGLAAALAGSNDRERAAEPTSATGRTLTDADRSVLDLVPAAFVDSCIATYPLPSAAIGSVSCTDGEVEVRYDTYEDATALDRAFAASTAGIDLLGLSCRDDRAATGPYTVDGASRGRVACFIEPVTVLASDSVVVWTDDELLVLGRASREDVTPFPGNLPDLSQYEWWRTSAGPNVGGSFRQKDQAAELPSGTFVSVIRPAQVGATNLGGADGRWVGTWMITLDGATFTEAFQDADTSDGDASYEIESELLWGKEDRMVLRRDYTFPPLGGVTAECRRYESVHWELRGDTLVFSDPSPERECQAFRRLAVYQPWERAS